MTLFFSCVYAQTDKPIDNPKKDSPTETPIETPNKTKANATKIRFVKLDQYGARLPDQNKTHADKAWACVIDLKSKLTWEVKSRIGTINKNTHTYSWYNGDPNINGGFVGLHNNGHCTSSPCNTQSFAQYLSQKNYCGLSRWRVPTREELRSLVDYHGKFPGPAINAHYFPNTISQFYWSVSPDASNSDSAWGIGFTFGYDYSYFKADVGHLRLVHDDSVDAGK